MLETKKRTLIVCPICELKEKTTPLGEIGPDGEFFVQTRAGGTIIISNAFEVICGRCGEVVYRKNK